MKIFTLRREKLKLKERKKNGQNYRKRRANQKKKKGKRNKKQMQNQFKNLNSQDPRRWVSPKQPRSSFHSGDSHRERF